MKTYEQAMIEVQAALTLAKDIWRVEALAHMSWIGHQYASICRDNNTTPCMEHLVSKAISVLPPMEKAIAQDLVVSTAWAVLLEDTRKIS